MARNRNRDLSDDTGPRTMQLVENSLPDMDRPRMSAPIESELEAVEHKAAALLAARELSQWQFAQAHKELMQELNLLRQHLQTKHRHKKHGSDEK